MNIIKYRKLYYILSGAMIAVSIYALAVWGLKLGIDFTGGSLMEVEYKNERSSNDFIKEAIKSSGVEDVIIQPSGDKGAILRFKDIDEETHQDILSKLRGDKESDYLAEKSFTSIGPTIGNEMRIKSIWAISMVLIIIVFYRVRENLMKFPRIEFKEIVNKSLNQTFIRSLNTSLTVILVLFAIYFFGGQSIHNFALVLLIGIGAGTYSSIFIASPILITWLDWNRKSRGDKIN